MNNCDICPLVASQQAADDEVILQTDRWVAVLDRNQSYLGKAFVSLRQHKATLSDLDQSDWQELHEVMRRMEYATKQAFGADVCNWECLMNNAVKAGQPTHVHWHLHPRYVAGTNFAGVDFPDTKWPRIQDGVQRMVEPALYQQIMHQLRRQLSEYQA